MRLLFYLGNLRANDAGTYTYSLALLRLFCNSKEIETIFLLTHDWKIDYDSLECFKQPKVKFIFFRKRKFTWKLFYHLRKQLLVLVKIILFGNHLKSLQTGFNSTILFDRNVNIKKVRFYRKIESKLDPFISFVNSIPADLFFVPAQIAPCYGINRPVIITMHDLQELHFPEFFTSETRLFRALYYKQALEESNHIIVSFNHVKDDIIRFFGIEESKISVCPIPFSNDWYFRDACTTKIELIERYKLPNNFILNPASITRHKNHGTLFQAVKLLKQKGIKFQIVCTGNTEMSNPYFIELLSLVDQLGIVEEVNFIGMVPACDLISLYKSARLVVIPTLYEAGSGPLFEAMYYGSVVICSNVTSLPESIGNTDFVFDPQNPSELAMLMEKGFFDDNFRKKNIVNSRRRIEELNKTEFFNPFYQAFQKAIRSDS